MVENTNICEGGWMVTDDGFEDGWWQGEARNELGSYVCGSPGFKDWAPVGEQTAHCCADYVLHYEEEILAYRRFPENYMTSTFTTGDLANQFCLDNGYTGGVCTKGQVGYAGSTAHLDTKMCDVGWIKNEDGSYDAGYYHTEGDCGDRNTWISLEMV